MAICVPQVNEGDFAKIKIRVGGDPATKPGLQAMCDGRQIWGVRRVTIEEVVDNVSCVTLELCVEQDTIEIAPEVTTQCPPA